MIMLIDENTFTQAHADSLAMNYFLCRSIDE